MKAKKTTTATKTASGRRTRESATTTKRKKRKMPLLTTTYSKTDIQNMKKEIIDNQKKLESYANDTNNKNQDKYKKILRTVFAIGQNRRARANQLGMNVNGYSDSILESWKPRQSIYPVTRGGNPLTANAMNQKMQMANATVPYYHNPEQDLDYLIYEDLYSYTMGGPIIREFVKFLLGRGFKPKLIPKDKTLDNDAKLELIKKHQNIISDLMAIDENIGNPSRTRGRSAGINIPFKDKISRIVANSLVFNRSCALHGYDEPVVVDGTEYTNIPSSLKEIHPRDMGIIEIDNETWNLKSVQIRQNMFEGSGFVDVKDMFYFWNSVSSAPAYQSDYYGISMLRNMYDELRTLRRLISINFPTYADAMHTGIPVVTINPEGTTEAQREKEGNDIVYGWNDGGPNVLFKHPDEVKIDNITFDPKIQEFNELAQTLTKFAVMKGSLPQSLFFAENEANMATLRYRTQLAISVNVNPKRAEFERAWSSQWYMPSFDIMYGGSEEHKLFDIGVEFEDLQIETLDDRVNTASLIHNDLAPLTPAGMGQYLQDPNFESKVDMDKLKEQEKMERMTVQDQQTREKYQVSQRNTKTVQNVQKTNKDNKE